MGTPAASYAADCIRGINFTNVAGALFADYDSVFYVDIATYKFVEYRQSATRSHLRNERVGENFFDAIYGKMEDHIYPDDRERLKSYIIRKNEIIAGLKYKAMTILYRLFLDRAIVWCAMKIALTKNGKGLIVGIYSIDEAMKDVKKRILG